MVKTLPSNSGCAGSISGWGAKIPHASWPKHQSIKQKQCCNKLNKDFQIGPHRKKKNLKKKGILFLLDSRKTLMWMKYGIFKNMFVCF